MFLYLYISCHENEVRTIASHGDLIYNFWFKLETKRIYVKKDKLSVLLPKFIKMLITKKVNSLSIYTTPRTPNQSIEKLILIINELIENTKLVKMFDNLYKESILESINNYNKLKTDFDVEYQKRISKLTEKYERNKIYIDRKLLSLNNHLNRIQ